MDQKRLRTTVLDQREWCLRLLKKRTGGGMEESLNPEIYTSYV